MKNITTLDHITIDGQSYEVIYKDDTVCIKDGDMITPLHDWLNTHDVTARTKTAPDGRPLWMDQEEYDAIMERSIEEYEVMDGHPTDYPDIRVYAPYGYED